ncbi:alpha-1,2-fucosyltransferase [Pedobacter fastidiosus]|uniref:Alpha-1,2-fucosyltransferase n=1 Tax=Pedobacter fastidiosus TaxID=2765361 RepID=A0ABR7KWU9_9SPHI|nr:alpha-1,2-fucosyltransferase [Pedobacter fastidiosus]MBC6112178.1 alpha-1,2-fucosyltransferase [Pedobacter fastidiosus]
MIAVQIEGRMGNQLFQYAFAHATAKKLGVKFYLDKSIEPYLLTEYFNVKKDAIHFLDTYLFRIKGFKNLLSHHLKRIFYQRVKISLGLKIEAFSNELLFNEQKYKIADRLMYQGFFQSEDYFSSAKDEIKHLFEVKNRHQVTFKKITANFPKDKNIIAIHVRRTDYLEIKLALPIAYYHDVISEFDFEKNFFVFISDDPTFVENEFSYIHNKYVSNSNAITDFQFLVHSDTCVISNSSFSWWGAYLNKKNAKVIAPQFWSGFAIKSEEPKGILMKNWILKPVA